MPKPTFWSTPLKQDCRTASYELICTHLFAGLVISFSAEMFFCFCLINKRVAPYSAAGPDNVVRPLARNMRNVSGGRQGHARCDRFQTSAIVCVGDSLISFQAMVFYAAALDRRDSRASKTFTVFKARAQGRSLTVHAELASPKDKLSKSATAAGESRYSRRKNMPSLKLPA